MLIDVILLLILVACLLSGYRKGLLMSLMGLLVTVLCCLGATAAQNALTPRAVSYLEPRLERLLLPSVEAELSSSAGDALEQAENVGFTVGGQSMTLSDLTGLLKRFGLDVEATVDETAESALRPVAAAISGAIARFLAEKAAGALIFFCTFLILYLLLHSAALAVNVVDRLPVIHTCNRLGGAVFGLLGSLLVMVVAAAILSDTGLLPDELGPLSRLLVDTAGRALG